MVSPTPQIARGLFDAAPAAVRDFSPASVFDPKGVFPEDTLPKAAFQKDAFQKDAIQMDGRQERTERLRCRAARHGPRALEEVEVLELLLSRHTPANAAAPADVAAALLTRFGDLPRVFAATLPELALVVGQDTALEVKLAHDLALRMLELPLRTRDLLSSFEAVKRYLRASLAGATREAFHVLYLDSANRLIADEVMGEGTVNGAPVYPREVVRRALELGALNCCLVHNHPAGNSNPSKADLEITRQTVAAAKALGITVHDHYLVAGDEVRSFKALGAM